MATKNPSNNGSSARQGKYNEKLVPNAKRVNRSYQDNYSKDFMAGYKKGLKDKVNSAKGGSKSNLGTAKERANRAFNSAADNPGYAVKQAGRATARTAVRTALITKKVSGPKSKRGN